MVISCSASGLFSSRESCCLSKDACTLLHFTSLHRRWAPFAKERIRLLWSSESPVLQHNTHQSSDPSVLNLGSKTTLRIWSVTLSPLFHSTSSSVAPFSEGGHYRLSTEIDQYIDNNHHKILSSTIMKKRR
jgi:hypothetical protein